MRLKIKINQVLCATCECTGGHSQAALFNRQSSGKSEVLSVVLPFVLKRCVGIDVKQSVDIPTVNFDWRIVQNFCGTYLRGFDAPLEEIIFHCKPKAQKSDPVFGNLECVEADPLPFGCKRMLILRSLTCFQLGFAWRNK